MAAAHNDIIAVLSTLNQITVMPEADKVKFRERQATFDLSAKTSHDRHRSRTNVDRRRTSARRRGDEQPHMVLRVPFAESLHSRFATNPLVEISGI